MFVNPNCFTRLLSLLTLQQKYIPQALFQFKYDIGRYFFFIFLGLI
jgi:hypothetical protein